MVPARRGTSRGGSDSDDTNDDSKDARTEAASKIATDALSRYGPVAAEFLPSNTFEALAASADGDKTSLYQFATPTLKMKTGVAAF